MKSNKFRFATALLLAALVFTACGQQSDPMQERVAKRCRKITAVYADAYARAKETPPQEEWGDQVLSQKTVDAIEELLVEAGYDVMDTNAVYPAYLMTAEKFRGFWEGVQRDEAGEQEVIRISESGDLSYMLFTYENGEATLFCAYYDIEEGSLSFFETHRILDWELTKKGNFFYQIYPGDNKHYADYEWIRMTAPDPERYDMTLRYILPVGYLATNLFLCDWSEADYGELSFNDLWEYFYYCRYNTKYHPAPGTDGLKPNSYQIPAAEFEEIVMPYFRIGLDTFREMAMYDSEGDWYPWRFVETDDFPRLWYYTCTPEVTAYEKNPDGTLTLHVEVLSTDLKMDCLFAHDVTVRPVENGQFQYVGNRVTYQTEYGLPYSEARLLWD